MVLDDKKIGIEMREARKKAGLSGRAVAARLGLSPAYICDLELGRRSWNADKRKYYMQALQLRG